MAEPNAWLVYADVLDLVYELLVRSLATWVVFGVAAWLAEASDAAPAAAVLGAGFLAWVIGLAVTVRTRVRAIREWLERRGASVDVRS
jgi:hypothetical protein